MHMQAEPMLDCAATHLQPVCTGVQVQEFVGPKNPLSDLKKLLVGLKKLIELLTGLLYPGCRVQFAGPSFCWTLTQV